MPLYVISYDLRAPNKDYQPLWDEMDRLGGHKPLQSVYFLNVNTAKAATLREHLAKFIDDNDQLIVVPFDDRPAHQKANSGTNDWINSNL
ncbi:CRISPR-associated endonuclease Cas2 [Paracoccus saliphilus]|uniref:CRISPR-associated endoribonuclease Cas2 n=1 Tax=Paracoccus saliphilus TaxID=405559 RepID=A0AA45W4M1_9RHOB|nr:CRISPR-associated endonuclease Cas2 [Paracoccus saliphilus]WCR04565.1 CRISPR-associated endonuclease Cas2 [Paracoccus saliphilus]SIS86869.1 CRISPR associated protein Cas2 [Paracoccus saliphilus]